MKKLTIEVEFFEESKMETAIFDAFLKGASTEGMKINSIRSGWISEETENLLVRAHNKLVDLERDEAE